MAFPAISQHSVARTARTLVPTVWLVLCFALAFGLAGAVVDGRAVRLVLLAVALTLVSLAVIILAVAGQARRRRRAEAALVGRFVAHDASPSFTTDDAGQIGFQNRAATDRFGDKAGQTLIRALGDLFAHPSAVIYRLQSRAAATGAAREDVVTRRGHVRLSVHRIGAQDFLWRLEEMMDRSAAAGGAETLCLPMLTASRTGTILFMNEAMRRLLGGRAKALDQVFPRLPLVSGEEVELRGAEGLVRARVADLEGSGGRREVFLLPTGDGPLNAAPAAEGFEAIPVALVRLSGDGMLRAANRQARDLLHLAPGELVRLADLVEGPGRPLADWLADALAGRAAGRPEVLRGKRAPGDPFLHVTLRPARDPETDEVGLVAVLTDATAFKSLEAQVLQSQKMQAIGQLAGGIAHDFNNLLTAIAGHCDLLLLRHDHGDPDYGDLVQIRQNANRAASLVGQLLAFSRKQTLKPEVIDVGETLGELTHLLNRLVGERVTLALMRDPDLPRIRADRRQLEQVIMNLVVNARDAMPEGGEIRVETETVDLRAELPRDRTVLPPGRYAVIRVRDEGEGIAPENLQKIYEPFFTTKRQGGGTGLGLSTAYGIVKQTGGFIFVDSAPGRGTTFTLWFAAHDPALPGHALPEATEDATGLLPDVSREWQAASRPGASVDKDARALRPPFAASSAPSLAPPPTGGTPGAAQVPCHPDDPAGRTAADGGGGRLSMPAPASAADADRIVAEGLGVAACRRDPAPAATAGREPPADTTGSGADGTRAVDGTGTAQDAARAPSPAGPQSVAARPQIARPLVGPDTDAPPDHRAAPTDRRGPVGPGAQPGAAVAARGGTASAPDGAAPGRMTDAAGGGAPFGLARPRDEGIVLLVEDEAPVRAFASRALRLHGYTVLEAASAEDALDILRDPAVEVDLFLTDVVMPGLDGPGWVREALRDRPGVHVVFVSGYAEDSLSEAREEIPNSVFLPKPFSLRDLTAVVQAQIG